MKDLDFDELDRAVNSLMSNVPKSEPQTDGSPEKTLDIPSTGDDKLSFDKVTEAAKKAAGDTLQDKTPEKSPPVPTPVLAPASPAPRASAEASHASATVQPANSTPAGRRGGRFMDVVHPSADMKKPDAPKSVSRQGVTLEPLNSAQKITDVVPQKKDVKDAKDASESAAAPAPAPIMGTPEKEKPAASPMEPSKPPVVEEKPSDTPAASSDWPDPLDMMTPAAPEKKEDAAVEHEPMQEMPQPETEPDTMPAPLTSPFLPDAKVEKRPLGGLASEESEITNDDDISRAPMADDTKKSVDDPNKQLPADPTEVEPILPEELSGDLMVVEADTTHAELKRVHDEGAQQNAPAAVQETPAVTESLDTKESSTSPAMSAEEEKPVSAGPTSIPQQYKEEPNTGDQDNGSIYDTDTYHQPLSHPAQKKSGWMWVVWIVLILLVGAGGGALLYILKLV